MRSYRWGCGLKADQCFLEVASPLRRFRCDSLIHAPLEPIFCRMAKPHSEPKVGPSPSRRRQFGWTSIDGGLATTRVSLEVARCRWSSDGGGLVGDTR
jgi:hypothetical protein